MCFDLYNVDKSPLVYLFLQSMLIHRDEKYLDIQIKNFVNLHTKQKIYSQVYMVIWVLECSGLPHSIGNTDLTLVIRKVVAFIFWLIRKRQKE